LGKQSLSGSPNGWGGVSNRLFQEEAKKSKLGNRIVWEGMSEHSNPGMRVELDGKLSILDRKGKEGGCSGRT